LGLRCRIVLACAQGATNQEVAARLGVHQATVGKWRGRFVASRLDGLHDEPRPGAPRKISDAHVERVIVKTLEETPADATHWSTRSMAKASGLNQTAVSRIWRAFGLKPHLAESFKLSPDPQFIRRLQRGTHRSVKELVAAIRTWITNWNDHPNPFVWHKTADEIHDSLAAYRSRTSDSGH
jgi:transposase